MNDPRNPEAGMSLVEIVASLVVLMFGVLAYYQGSFRSMQMVQHSRTNDEIALAVRNALAELRNHDFSLVATDFGIGSGQEDFWINGSGQVVYAQPTETLATGTYEFFLEENNIPTEFGMPSDELDLDSDGIIESGVVTTYKALPVRINLQLDRSFGTLDDSYWVILSE